VLSGYRETKSIFLRREGGERLRHGLSDRSAPSFSIPLLSEWKTASDSENNARKARSGAMVSHKNAKLRSPKALAKVARSRP
jgi:hypothetical protein